MKTARRFLAYVAHLFLKWEVFQARVAEELKTHILCSITFFPPENRATYGIMWKNTLEWGRPQMTIWHMHIACWVTKSTHTHSQYWILVAFPLQQWLQECTPVLHYRYIACLCISVVTVPCILFHQIYHPKAAKFQENVEVKFKDSWTLWKVFTVLHYTLLVFFYFGQIKSTINFSFLVLLTDNLDEYICFKTWIKVYSFMNW